MMERGKNVLVCLFVSRSRLCDTVGKYWVWMSMLCVPVKIDTHVLTGACFVSSSTGRNPVYTDVTDSITRHNGGFKLQ